VAAAVEGLVGANGRVGVAGAGDALNPATRAELSEALHPYETVDADALMAAARGVKRPRELLALERSAAVARAAVRAAVERFHAGASDAEALLAAERVARMGGGRDVRVLGTVGGGALAPVQRLSDERGERLVAYCAVERLGYWGEATACSAPAPVATAAVEAMISAAGVGVHTAELARAAVARLPGGEADVALSYGLGAGIGLDPSEGPLVAAAGGGTIPAGAVLALRAFTSEGGGLSGAAETIVVDEGGARRL
jgi:Xaa-Pro aminopeptidase